MTIRSASNQAELSSAITASLSGDTIKLTQSFTVTSALPSINFDITLDGGGNTLTATYPLGFIKTNVNVVNGLTLAGTGVLSVTADGSGGALTGTFTNNGNLEFFRPANYTHAGDITGNGRLGIQGLQGDSITLTGNNNSFSGFTALQSASLHATTGHAIGDTSLLSISGGTLFVDATETVGSLNGGGSIVVAAGQNIIVGGDFGGNSGTFNGIGAGISGSGGLVAQGGNQLYLQGTHSYTGATEVYSSLFVAGDNSSSSLTTVHSGASLGSWGTLGAVKVESGGSLIASNYRLTSGDVKLDSGAKFQISVIVSSFSANLLSVNGTVDLSGAILNASLNYGVAPAVGSVFTLIENDGTDAITGTFAGLVEGASLTLSNQKFHISYVGGTGNDVVLIAEGPTSTSTPTPSPTPTPVPTPTPGTGVSGAAGTAPSAGGVVRGSTGNDILTGLGGRDTFFPGTGTDTIDGGAGVDSVVFVGARTAYSITRDTSGNFVVSTPDGKSAATLKNVERIVFDDQTLALDSTPNSGRIAALYKVALGRNPESDGLDYYLDAIASKVPTLAMATGFVASSEFNTKYGQLSDSGFIDQMYANTFQRAPDSGGRAFFLDLLASHPGLAGRALMLTGFIESPEMTVKITGQMNEGVALLS